MITSFFKAKNNAGGEGSGGGSKRSREQNDDGGTKRTKLLVVDEFLSHLKDNDKDDDDDSSSWRESLEKYTSASPTFFKLAEFISKERNSPSKKIYPPPSDTFTALNWTPLSTVKVVIVGQDPYHGPNQAHGLCFSVRKGVDIPPSLKNIYKELANDKDISNFPNPKGMPRHGYLERWAKQGVLMLNAVLTVRQSEANSHRKKGWEHFTDQIIKILLKEKSEKGLVFLLWGRSATEKATNIINTHTNKKKMTVIKSSHPSPLGASKTKEPFLGSKCFSRANDALVKYGYDPIDWNVDDE